MPGVVHSEQVEHCLERGIIGIGWRMDELPDDAPLTTVVHAIKKRTDPGWGPRAAQIVRRFGDEAEIGDFVWTRDTLGRYLLCRISGPYQYDISEAAKAVDVHQVRPAEWAPKPLNDLEVPGGVIRRFVGIGESFSRIHDDGARRLTSYLWEKLHNRALPKVEISPREVLTTHLDPYDVEDLVYVWLQVVRHYVAMPRARQRDTPAYEWTMVHGGTHRRGIVQIKTGSDSVDLAALDAARADDETDTFAFATSETYHGKRELVTEVIKAEDLLAFAREHPSLLPARVRTWFELAR